MQLKVERAFRSDDVKPRDPDVSGGDCEVRITQERHADCILQRDSDERLLGHADDPRRARLRRWSAVAGRNCGHYRRRLRRGRLDRKDGRENRHGGDEGRKRPRFHLRSLVLQRLRAERLQIDAVEFERRALDALELCDRLV